MATRKERALQLLARVRRGPDTFDAATAKQYRLWASSWVTHELAALVPELRGVVDGDLLELSPEALSFLRGEIDRIDGAPRIPAGVDGAVAGAIKRNHWERRQAQEALRNALAWYSGLETARGRPDIQEQYRRFYFAFGVDVATAQTLNAKDAEALRARVAAELAKFGVDASVSAGLHSIAQP